MMVSIGTPTSSGGSGCRATAMIELLVVVLFGTRCLAQNLLSTRGFRQQTPAPRRLCAGPIREGAVIPGGAPSREPGLQTASQPAPPPGFRGRARARPE